MSVVQECGDVVQNKGGGPDLLYDTQEIGKQKILFQDLISRHSGEVSAVVCTVREVPLVRCECSCFEVNGACEAESGAGGGGAVVLDAADADAVSGGGSHVGQPESSCSAVAG